MPHPEQRAASLGMKGQTMHHKEGEKEENCGKRKEIKGKWEKLCPVLKVLKSRTKQYQGPNLGAGRTYVDSSWRVHHHMAELEPPSADTSMSVSLHGLVSLLREAGLEHAGACFSSDQQRQNLKVISSFPIYTNPDSIWEGTSLFTRWEINVTNLLM